MSKIAIINRANLINYGSVLQCYALLKTVSDLGYESELLWEKGNLLANYDLRPRKLISIMTKLVCHPSLLFEIYNAYRHVKNKKYDPASLEMFDSFVKSNIVQKSVTHRELIDMANSAEYKKFICGSDQVWASTALYVDPLMYLRFAPEEKRVAYAPSIGRDTIPRYNRRKMKKYISGIPNASIREYEGQRLIKELTNREVPVVLDPTLLLNAEQWKSLCHIDNIPKSGFLLTYFLDEPLPEVQQAILSFAEEHRLDILQLGCAFRGANPDSEICLYHPSAGPEEFIAHIDLSDFVVTDSYHGMLFSIIFRKQFCSVKRESGKYDQSSRQKTVLKDLHLDEKYFELSNISADLQIKSVLEKSIDYDAVERILIERIEKSKNFLREAL